MSLAEDLLEQAEHLSQREAVGPPRQASLRRAVSAAYYAVFHLLANAASTACAPSSPHGLRTRVQRALEHAGMKDACNRIVKSSVLNTPYSVLLAPATSYSAELVELAAAFVELQEARHTADYDLERRHSRSDVLNLIEEAHHAFAAWELIRGSSEANIFLADLYFGKRWGR